MSSAHICCTALDIDADLPSQIAAELLRNPQWGQELEFSNTQNLFYQGHEPIGIYLLKSGAVKINYTKLLKSTHATVQRSGTILGLNHLLAGSALCGSGEAIGRVKVQFISKAEILQLIKNLKKHQNS